MRAGEFWNIPRNTKPEQLFGPIAEALPVRLPVATLSLPVNIEVRGAGGGTFSGRLVEGRLEMQPARRTPAICTVSMERATLRELVSGALRDRGLAVMAALGKSGQVPNLSRLPVREDRAQALAKVAGSCAIELVDRGYGETHRIVVTFGDAAPAFEHATTTVRIDVDDVVQWIASRADPRVVLRGGRVRVDGDLALPTRVLALLLDP